MKTSALSVVRRVKSASENATASLLIRSSNDWVTPVALRSLLKSSLGYNARQVTVSGGSSLQYLTITVRDPAVDVRKVEAFAKNFATWTMDNTDYCEGQSVNVRTTSEVNEVRAAPYLAEITATAPRVEMDKGLPMPSGCVLWLTSQGFYVSKDNERRPYVWEYDVRQGTEWAIKRLALSVAELV